LLTDRSSNSHLLDGVAAPLQLGDERSDVQLGAAFDEGHLRVGDDDSLDVNGTFQLGVPAAAPCCSAPSAFDS
jgi:hypothetical protein